MSKYCEEVVSAHVIEDCEPRPLGTVITLLNRHEIDLDNPYRGRRCHLKACGAINLYLESEPEPTHCAKCGKKIRNVKKIYKIFGGGIVRANSSQSGD